MILLSTRLELHAQDEARLVAKASRLRTAAALLLSAALVGVISSIVTVILGGE